MKVSTSQLQLTRSADYAVRAMIHLAAQPDGARVLLPALANDVEAPGSFLSKVLQSLSRARLISSRRGPFGGFAILPRGLQASIREVIEAVEGPIQLNLCLQDGRSCSRKAWCPAHGVWARAQDAMLTVLNEAIVADLAAVPRPEAASLGAGPNGRSEAGIDAANPRRSGLILLSR